jgi:DNA repair photolyase
MVFKPIKVDSVLNKITSKDRLFLGNYTLDPYSNCEFGCVYCDSAFDKTIYVKMNAPEILEKELKGKNKGRIIVGSVHDPYQNAEKKYMLTRKLLEKISEYDSPCHILTKSDLVLRDIDVLKKIKDCFVTVSLVSINKDISNTFEKNAPEPTKRLKIVKKLNSENIKSGVALIPFLPYFSERNLEELLESLKKSNARYLLFKHLELKGDQKQYFLKMLSKNYPSFVERYNILYKDSYKPDESYIKDLSHRIHQNFIKYDISNKIETT